MDISHFSRWHKYSFAVSDRLPSNLIGKMLRKGVLFMRSYYYKFDLIEILQSFLLP